MEWTQCHDHLVLSRELLLMNQNSGSFVRKFGVSRGDVIQQQTERNSLSFTTFISLFNESICRASLNEHISNSFPLFRFCVQSNSTQSVYLVGLKILFSRTTACAVFSFLTVLERKGQVLQMRPNQSRAILIFPITPTTT